MVFGSYFYWDSERWEDTQFGDDKLKCSEAKYKRAILSSPIDNQWDPKCRIKLPNKKNGRYKSSIKNKNQWSCKSLR